MFENMNAPTAEAAVTTRAGGSDDTRTTSAPTGSQAPEPLANPPRCGGPDDTRQDSNTDKGSGGGLPNTPRGDVTTTRD
jgi:hypothetical protein